MKKNNAVIAGHICVDFTPPIECNACMRIDDILAPGKLIHTGPAELHPGGVVANTGLAMKILGADVSLIGKVGDDSFGKMILRILQDYGKDDGIIVDASSSTSYTVVIAVPGIDRIFLNNHGANDTFSADDIDYEKCRNSLLFHFGYPTLMKKMYESDGHELSEMFQRVKNCGCITSLDTAAVDESSDAGRADWEKILMRTLPYVDFFMPSIEEICFMLDREKYHELQKRSAGRDVTAVISPKDDAAPIAERLLNMGCKMVMLKCGVSGFYYMTADRKAFAELKRISGLNFADFDGRSGFEKSFVPDAVVSGTGAGDVTIAAFLAAVMKGFAFDDCIKLASGAGACCVSSFNALDGLMTLEELRKKIDRGWQKQKLFSERYKENDETCSQTLTTY